MPIWCLPQVDFEIPRNIALLDTNVLVAFANPADEKHADTLAALDLGQYRWAVAPPTIIEAWNLLVGRNKLHQCAYYLMDWILTPGNVILLDDNLEPLKRSHDISKMGVDIVDAGLINLADRISKICSMRPAVHVATYDAADFLRFFGHDGLDFNVYDLRDLSSTAE